MGSWIGWIVASYARWVLNGPKSGGCLNGPNSATSCGCALFIKICNKHLNKSAPPVLTAGMRRRPRATRRPWLTRTARAPRMRSPCRRLAHVRGARARARVCHAALPTSGARRAWPEDCETPADSPRWGSGPTGSWAIVPWCEAQSLPWDLRRLLRLTSCPPQSPPPSPTASPPQGPIQLPRRGGRRRARGGGVGVCVWGWSERLRAGVVGAAGHSGHRYPEVKQVVAILLRRSAFLNIGRARPPVAELTPKSALDRQSGVQTVLECVYSQQLSDLTDAAGRSSANLDAPMLNDCGAQHCRPWRAWGPVRIVCGRCTMGAPHRPGCGDCMLSVGFVSAP